MVNAWLIMNSTWQIIFYDCIHYGTLFIEATYKSGDTLLGTENLCEGVWKLH